MSAHNFAWQSTRTVPLIMNPASFPAQHYGQHMYLNPTNTPVASQFSANTYHPMLHGPTYPSAIRAGKRDGPVIAPGINTEARKIIITHSPQRVTRTSIMYLLLKVLQSDYATTAPEAVNNGPIQSLKLSTFKDGTSKGTAFAVLESQTIAKKVIRALNGHNFEGRELIVRLTKEGVPRKVDSPTSKSHKEASGDIVKEKLRRSASVPSDQPSRIIEGHVTAVDGPSPTRSPLVVDGSSATSSLDYPHVSVFPTPNVLRSAYSGRNEVLAC